MHINVEELTMLERFVLIAPYILAILAEVIGVVGLGAIVTKWLIRKSK